MHANLKLQNESFMISYKHMHIVALECREGDALLSIHCTDVCSAACLMANSAKFVTWVNQATITLAVVYMASMGVVSTPLCHELCKTRCVSCVI